MTEITLSESVILEVLSNFSWSQNDRISLSSSCLWIVADDLGELRGRVTFLLEDPISTELTTERSRC